MENEQQLLNDLEMEILELDNVESIPSSAATSGSGSHSTCGSSSCSSCSSSCA